jgi:hypothetical protein
MIANRLATNGDDWTEVQVRHNSGTCNNQWIIVDYKLFQPGKELVPGTVWISETMPGIAMRADVTATVLHQGSWPSYNIPYFVDTWRAGGWEAMQKQHPDQAAQFSYYDCPRARMFKEAREKRSITSLDTFMKWMRRNVRQDPLAEGDSCNAISARCDLNPQDSHVYDCFGAHDSKVTSWRGPGSAGDLSFFGVLSPTFDDQKPFSWSDQNVLVDTCRPEQHVGHPDTFNFGWHTFPSAVEADEALGFSLAEDNSQVLLLSDLRGSAKSDVSENKFHLSVSDFFSGLAASGGCLVGFAFVVGCLAVFFVRMSDDVAQDYISLVA